MANINNGIGYFMYVRNIQDVHNYNLSPGSNGFFMEIDNPVLHNKSVDIFNNSTIESYDLVKRVTDPVPPAVQNPQSVGSMLTAEQISEIVSKTVKEELDRRYHEKKQHYKKDYSKED